MHRILLDFLFLQLALQIMRQVIIFPGSRHNPRCMRKHIVHLLERHFLGLRQEDVEEDRVREIANHEEEIVAVMNIFHRNGRNLTDHGIESERGHGSDRDTLGTRARVEYLGRNNPRQGTAGC